MWQSCFGSAAIGWRPNWAVKTNPKARVCWVMSRRRSSLSACRTPQIRHVTAFCSASLPFILGLWLVVLVGWVCVGRGGRGERAAPPRQSHRFACAVTAHHGRARYAPLRFLHWRQRASSHLSDCFLPSCTADQQRAGSAGSIQPQHTARATTLALTGRFVTPKVLQALSKYYGVQLTTPQLVGTHVKGVGRRCHHPLNRVCG